MRWNWVSGNHLVIGAAALLVAVGGLWGWFCLYWMTQLQDRAMDDEPITPEPTVEPIVKPVEKPAKEIGGRNGPDPVRYGDWEKGGIAVDF